MEYDTLVHRKCRECGIEGHSKTELLLKFRKRKAGKHGYDNLCRECATKKQRVAWADPLDRKKAHQLKKRYNCTPEEYNERMSSSSCCEICSKENDLVYDHCHDSMDFRGVLCRGCNRSLGQLGDSLESIQKVVAYLSKTC